MRIKELATRVASSEDTYYVANWQLFDQNRTDIFYLVMATCGSGDNQKTAISIMQYRGAGVNPWKADITSNCGVSGNGYSIGMGNGNSVYDTSLKYITFYSIPLI